MPRSFFDQVLVSTPQQRPRRWVTVGSVILHGLVLGVIFVLPLTAAVALPDVRTPMPAMMMAVAAPLPPEPAPASAAPTPQMSADAAPIKAPDTVSPEVARPPVSTVPAVPGGLPGVGSPDGYPALPGTATPSTGITTPPPPRPQAPQRVGGVIQEPKRLTYKAPVYPQVAMAARIDGTVILEATIDAQGVVQNVTVLKSVPMLDRAAIDAVQQWRYMPTRLNGQAVPIIMTVTVTFRIR
jgi:protein TonB